MQGFTGTHAVSAAKGRPAWPLLETQCPCDDLDRESTVNWRSLEIGVSQSLPVPSIMGLGTPRPGPPISLQAGGPGSDPTQRAYLALFLLLFQDSLQRFPLLLGQRPLRLRQRRGLRLPLPLPRQDQGVAGIDAFQRVPI